MPIRPHFGCLIAAALAVSACKGNSDAGASKQCESLAKACGDKDKHIEKLVAECKQAEKKHADKGCGDKLAALHSCYTKDLCGSAEKVWALDDLRVLANRHEKCVMERAAARECIDK
jgi:hypothetical protein